jgi:hypothetical protein
MSTRGPRTGRAVTPPGGICRLQQSKAQIVEELNVLRRKLDAADADNAALKEKSGAQAIDASAAAAGHTQRELCVRALGRGRNSLREFAWLGGGGVSPAAAAVRNA